MSNMDNQQQVFQSYGRKRVPDIGMVFFQSIADWIPWQRAFASAAKGLGLPHIICTAAATKRGQPDTKRENKAAPKAPARHVAPPSPKWEQPEPAPTLQENQDEDDYQQDLENWRAGAKRIDKINEAHLRDYMAAQTKAAQEQQQWEDHREAMASASVKLEAKYDGLEQDDHLIIHTAPILKGEDGNQIGGRSSTVRKPRPCKGHNS